MMDALANIDFGSVLSDRPLKIAKNANLEKAQEAAQEFEAFFLTQMLESMYAEMQPDPMFGGGQSEKIFRSFMLDEYGKMMAKSGGVGIADSIMSTLLQSQDMNNNGEKI